MIRGALPFARLAIDARAGAVCRQRRGHEDVIDAQPVVFGEGKLAVVPPAVQSAFAVVQPESIDQPPGAEVTQGGTRLRVEQYGALPGGRVVYVPRFGGDVEVTAEGKPLARVAVVIKITPQAPEPREFVDKFFAVHDLPVRHIHTHHPYPGDTGSEEACFLLIPAVGEYA